MIVPHKIPHLTPFKEFRLSPNGLCQAHCLTLCGAGGDRLLVEGYGGDKGFYKPWGFESWHIGFKVQGLGFKIQGSRLWVFGLEL